LNIETGENILTFMEEIRGKSMKERIMNGQEGISHTENFKQRVDLSLEIIKFLAFPIGSCFYGGD
jgi:hypothetical protein